MNSEERWTEYYALKSQRINMLKTEDPKNEILNPQAQMMLMRRKKRKGLKYYVWVNNELTDILRSKMKKQSKWKQEGYKLVV